MNETMTRTHVCLVPLKSVFPHERVDPRRVERLKADLQLDGVLRDPPIAARHNGQYIILDGATRTQALKELGALQIPLQVVRYKEPTVRLESWNHILLEIPASEVRERVQTVMRSQGQAIDPQTLQYELASDRYAFGLFSSNGTGHVFNRDKNHRDRIDQLCRVVAACQELTDIHRSHEFDLSILKSHYPHLSAVLVYPRFHPANVIQCVLDEVYMPAGITRHLLVERVLGLNLPLELLMDPVSLEEINRRLIERIEFGFFKRTRAENGESLLRFNAMSVST